MTTVADHLKTEELYQAVLALIYGPHHTQDINPDDIRRALDRIVSMSKAVGRRGALSERGRLPKAGETWRAKERPDDLVWVSSAHAEKVSYQHLDDATCGCRGKSAPHRERGHRSLGRLRDFLRLYEPVTEDRLVEEWLEIVDSDVPRETSGPRDE